MCDACTWEDWMDTIEGILDEAEDLPERAEDFAVSVIEKLESMLEWVQENQHITEKQIDAIRNMEAGVSRWKK